MRSYADTLSGVKPAGGASAASACFKFSSVMVGLLLIAGAVFVGIRFLPDKDSTGDNEALRDLPVDFAAPADPTRDDGNITGIPVSASATGGSNGNGLNSPFFKFATPATVDQSVMDYQYGDALGDCFQFFEAQHSGDLSSNVGGNRIKWRGEQLVNDGADVNRDLSGGMYEAGNRLKITLPTSYMISHMAWICVYYQDLYEQVQYQGKSLLYWCKREVKWGTDWLLKTHIYKGNERPSSWNSDEDKMVVMVGNTKDFDCFQRAELIPQEPDCGLDARSTLLANSSFNAADVAGHAAAALAASAALLQDDDPQYAVQAMLSAYAFYDFGRKHNKTAATWSEDVAETYGTTHNGQYMLYAASMIAWAHRCPPGENAPLCNDNKARRWLAIAEQSWEYQVASVPSRHKKHMISNWANPDYDTALLLTAVTGNITSPYGKHLFEFIEEYAGATDQISVTPKGLVRHADEQWSPLRLAYVAAFTALHFSSYPGVDAQTQQTARCFARGQMGYVLGDNPAGISYLTGFGTKWVTQVHHRDAACTLKEGVDGECVIGGADDIKQFFEDRPNPITLIGSVVGGPDEEDKFDDLRTEFKFTEVALDYNTGVMAGLGAMMGVPADFWSTDCSAVVPAFDFGPYPPKNSDDRTSAFVRGDDPNEGLDISEDVALEAGIPWDSAGDSSNEAKADSVL